MPKLLANIGKVLHARKRATNGGSYVAVYMTSSDSSLTFQML